MLTKKEVALYLRISTRTVELWMLRGLPHYKLGNRRTLFKQREIDDFLSDRCRVLKMA